MDIDVTDAALSWSWNLLYAAAILAVGLWFAFFISGFIRQEATKHPRIDTTLGTFMALVVRYGVIAFVLIAVLQSSAGRPQASLRCWGPALSPSA